MKVITVELNKIQDMKVTYISVVLTLFFFNSTSSFAQDIKEGAHPNIVVLSEEGKEDKRIYSLPCTSDYIIKREDDYLELLSGEDKEVDISGLVPGVYFIYYTNLDGMKMLDKFTIDWN